MITQVEAIKIFLSKKSHDDLARLYDEGMEVQVMIDKSLGERVESEWKNRKVIMYEDRASGQRFKDFRIPFNANTQPEFDLTKQMTWDLGRFASGIGMTGWNWKERVSKFFIYDFDSISGHSVNHTARLSSSQLEEVKKAAKEIPWVTVRKSTGGQGLHFYVFVEDIPTENHNMHAALARSILGKMSVVTGFDFESKIDVCGHVGWQWHTKMDKSNGEGLRLIKKGRVLAEEEIPANWREHYGVIEGSCRRARLSQAEESGSSELLEKLVNARNCIELDVEHRRLLEYLEEESEYSWWDQERRMLVCHTKSLEKAHKDLGLQGVFHTISKGSSEVNCYMFPAREGSWSVRRFSQGVAEHASWSIDSSGWTSCYFNRQCDFHTACRACEGIEVPDKDAFEFREASSAQEAIQLLNENVEIPLGLRGRPASLRLSKDSRLVVEIKHEPSDSLTGLEGWRIDTRKKMYTRINPNPFQVTAAAKTEDIVLYDGLSRHLVDMNGGDAGWVLRTDNEWNQEPLQHIALVLDSMGYNAKEKKIHLGGSILQKWKLVISPFNQEYPGNRRWNRDAAQLKYGTLPEDLETMYYPNWDKMLEHCGKSLDLVVQEDPWCKLNDVKSGRDYLFLWLCAMFQEPEQPLPYLFFYGVQNCGKSIFHEAVSLLFERGYQRADGALTNQQAFNGELEGCVLAVIEETDFSTSRIAYTRIKDWVTSPTFQIHRKGSQPYMSKNYLHFVHTSNYAEACNLGEGDTRVTVIYVEALQEGEVIPKKQFMKYLEKEAQQFLSALMKTTVPESNDRLRVPVVTSDEKRSIQLVASDPVKCFIEENFEISEGSFIMFREFYNKFIENLDRGQIKDWGERAVSMSIPATIVKGRLGFSDDKGQNAICNIFWKGKKDHRRLMGKLRVNANNYIQKPSKGK